MAAAPDAGVADSWGIASTNSTERHLEVGHARDGHLGPAVLSPGMGERAAVARDAQSKPLGEDEVRSGHDSGGGENRVGDGPRVGRKRGLDDDQPNLFDQPRQLEAAIDDIRRRHGDDAVRLGRALPEP